MPEQKTMDARIDELIDRLGTWAVKEWEDSDQARREVAAALQSVAREEREAAARIADETAEHHFASMEGADHDEFICHDFAFAVVVKLAHDIRTREGDGKHLDKAEGGKE